MTEDIKIEVPAAEAEAGAPETGLKATARDTFDAIVNFIHSNSHVESSACIGSVIDEIKVAPDLQTAFGIPIQYAILSLDGALRWTYFLAVAAKRGDPALPFSTDAAFELVADVYDIGTRDAVDAHFEDESDDSSDDSGDDSGDDRA